MKITQAARSMSGFLWLVLLLLLVGQVNPVFAAQKDSYSKCIKEGDKAFYAKDYVAAKEWFEKAAELKPEDEYPQRMLEKIDKIETAAENKAIYKEETKFGKEAFDEGDFETARTHFKKASEVNPKAKYPKDYLARIQANEDKFKSLMEQANDGVKADKPNYGQILTYLDEAATTIPSRPEPGAMRGYIERLEKGEINYEASKKAGIELYNSQNYNAAKEKFTEAIYANPKMADVYEMRGFCYYSLQDFSTAIEDFQQAVELNPKSYGAYLNIGNCNFSLSNADAAIRAYSDALKVEPAAAGAYYGRANTKQYFKKDWEGAIVDLNKALEIQPGYADAYYLRGYVKRVQGSYDAAIKDYQLSIDSGHINPDYVKKEIESVKNQKELELSGKNKPVAVSKPKVELKEMLVVAENPAIRSSRDEGRKENTANIIAKVDFGHKVQVKSMDDAWAVVMHDGYSRYMHMSNLGDNEMKAAMEKLMGNAGKLMPLGMDREALYQYYVRNKMLKSDKLWTLASPKTKSEYFSSVAIARTTTAWDYDMACIIEHPITRTRKLLIFTFDKTTLKGSLVYEQDLEQGYLVRPITRDQTRGDFQVGKKKMSRLSKDAFWVGHGTELVGNPSWVIQKGEDGKFAAHPQN